ncbi:Ig-like domain-containing protein [Vibrio vulnificus]
MSFALNTLKGAFRFFTLLGVGIVLSACDSDGDRFLDKNVDKGAKEVISTQLVIGGQTESITLSPGQETSIAVKVIYEDGSNMYLDPSEVTFEYERDFADESVTYSNDLPFIIDGFVLKAQVSGSVKVVAVHQGERTTPVIVEVHDKVITNLQLTPTEHLLIKGVKALFRLDAFYADGSVAQLASDVLIGNWYISDTSVVKVNNDDGWLEAMSSGKATIAYELNGVRSNEVTVTVSSEQVVSIDVTPTQIEVAKGAVNDVRAIATLSDGAKLNITSSVLWSQHSAINVDERGSVLGVAEEANIPLIASFSGIKSKPSFVTVKGPDINGLILSPSNTTISLSYKGSMLSLIAQYTDGSALPYSGVSSVTYTLDSDIIKIDANGTIHPVSKGVAIVEAKVKDRHDAWVVSNAVAISVVDSPLVNITLHADNTSVPKGIFTTLRAMGSYADGRVEDISEQVSWQSSSPSTLTVADGIAYGVDVGSVDVTAYLSGVLSNSVEMEVTSAKLNALQMYISSPKANVSGMVFLPVGLHGQAQAMASFSDGSVFNVNEQASWYSNDDAIISVDHNGLFQGEAKGETAVYASFTVDGVTKKSEEKSIKIIDAKPVRLDILPSQVSLVKGLSTELHAVATYSDGYVANVTQEQGLSWTTQDSRIATVVKATTSAQVTGVDVGRTTIKATWSDLEAQTHVTVEDKTLSGIVLYPIAQKLAKGAKGQMQVMGFYSDNTQRDITSSASNYHSHNDSVASVTTEGKVSALAAGSTVLTVSYGGFSAQAQLVVPEAKITSLRIEQSATSMVAGTTTNLTAIAVLDDGNELNVTSAAHWQSDVNSVSVDAGIVWAKDNSNPKAIITATFSGQQAQKTLSIAAPKLISLSLSPKSAHIVEGARQAFKLDAMYSDGSVVDVSKQAQWTSSNNAIGGFVPNTAILMASAPGDITTTAMFGGVSAEAVVYIADKTSAVKSLRVTPASLTLPEGGVSTIKVEANYSTAPSVFVDVTAQTAWQLNTDYAVIGEGVVVARQASLSPVTATAIYGGKQANVTVTITDAVVERLQLLPAQLTLAKGYSASLIADAFFTNGLVTQLVPKDVTWSLESGEGISIESSTGVVTATQAGKTAIVKAAYQGESATATITTTNATLEFVLLTDLNDNPLPHSMLLAKGMSVNTKLLGLLSDGTKTELDQNQVTYSITGGTVTQNAGTLTANQKGLSDITASYVANGKTYSSQNVSVAVSPAEVASISILTGDVTLVKGLSQKPQVQAVLSDGSALDVTANTTWAVNDDTIAQFVTNGNLTGVKEGQTTFVASFAGKSATAKVTVSNATLTHLSVSPQAMTITVGNSKNFTATAHFNNGTSRQLSSEVSWSVSNTNTTISNSGGLTAVSAGTATVTATLTSDPSKKAQATITIIDRNIQSINVTLGKTNIASGQSTTATAIATYTDKTSEDITLEAGWLSSDSDVALVTGGYIRGLKQGDVEIVATYRGVTSRAQSLVVSNATVSSVQLTPASVTLAKGYDTELMLTAIYTDNTTSIIDNSNVNWSVESGEGVTVSNGVIEATDASKTAVIKATYQGKSATTTVTTTAAKIDSIVLLDATTNVPLTSTVLPIGSTHSMKTIAYLSDGSEQKLSNGVSYKSTDATVATVTDNGNVTALKEGVTVITANYTSGGKVLTSNSTVINVTSASIKNIAIVPSFNPTSSRIVGLQYDLEVQATLTDNTTLNITSLVSWQSKDETIAKVIHTSHGTLEARKAGETEIRASYAGFSDTLEVKVIDATMTSLEVTPSNHSLNIGSTAQYKAFAYYNNGTELDITDQVFWSSNTSSATVESSSGLVSAISVGKATITATKGSISNSASLTITNKSVQAIQISASATSLPEGQNTQLSLVVTYTDGTQETNRTQDVLWVSSEPLSGVIKAGKFYALTKGTTNLMASFRGVNSNKLSMSVTDATLSQVQLTPASSTVAAGEAQYYTLIGMYTNGQSLDLTDQATWAVTKQDGSTTTIASSVNKGEVNTNSAGVVKVTATMGSFSGEAVLNIDNKTVSKVFLNQEQDIVLNLGETATPAVTIVYSNGSSDSVASNSSNLVFHTTNVTSRVAEFDTTTNGQLNTLSEGKTQAWVTYQVGNNTYTSESIDVVVTSKVVTGLAFTQTLQTLPKGTQSSFAVEATYSDGTTDDVTSAAAWISSDTDKITVLKGVITASNVNTGNSTITASYGGKSVSQSVAVSGAVLTNLTLTPASLQVHQGLKANLILTAHYSDNSTQEQTKAASWQSNATNKATVNQGVITGVAEGEASITATLGNKSVSAKVFVIERSVDRIEISLSKTTINKGERLPVTVNAYYQDDTSTAVNITNDVTWEVNHNVVHIAQSQLYGYEVGSTNIKASYKGKEASVNDFEVTNKALASLQLAPGSQSLPKGVSNTYELTAVYTDRTTAIIDNSTATWTISAGEGVSISNGKVKAVEANKTATVKVSYQGIETTANVTTTSATLQNIVLMDVAAGRLLNPVTLHEDSTKYYLGVNGLYSDGSIQALTSSVAYRVDGDAVTIASTNGWGMLVNASRTSNRARIYAEYTPTGGSTLSTASVPIEVTGAKVTSLKIIPSFDSSNNLMKGANYAVTAVAEFNDGTKIDVTSVTNWQSSKSSIAEISSTTKGMFNAKDKGDANISATYLTFSDSLAVTVADVSLQSIVVTPSNANVSIGDVRQFRAIGHYDNGDKLDITNQVNWSSSNSALATVNAKGSVYAEKAGDLKIYANKGSINGETDLTVSASGEVSTIQINVVQAKSLAVGENSPLEAHINFKNATMNDYDAANRVSWIVEDPRVGYVLDGVWYAIAEGNTKITATYGGVISNAEFLHVNVAKVTRLELSPSSKLELAKGRTYQINATAHYSDGSNRSTTQAATWTTSKESVATVSNGLVEAIGNVNDTTSTITASYGGKTASVDVEVKDAEAETLVLNGGAYVTLNQGDVLALPAQWVHSDGSTDDIDLTDIGFSFHVDNASVASFDTTTKNQITARVEGLTHVWIKHVNTSTNKVIQSDKVAVLVQSKKVTHLSLTQSTATLAKGSAADFRVQAHFTDGTTLEVTSSATWSTSDPDVVTVSRGVVTASNSLDLSAKNSAQIKASYGGQSVSQTVTVSAASLTHISISPLAATVNKGLTHNFVLTAHYSDGTSSIRTSAATWQSSASSIATVSNGVVTGVAQGEVVITATISSHTASAQVFVLDKKLDRIDIVLANNTIKVGESTAIQVNAYYEGATTVAVNVTSHTSLRTQNGRVSAFNSSIIGQTLGKDTITASFGGKSATKDIEVQGMIYKHLILSSNMLNFVEGKTTQVTLQGVGSDGSLTVLNDSSGIKWNLGDDTVIKMESDNKTLKGLVPGSSTLSAEFESLTSNSLTIEIVEKDKVLEVYVPSSRDTDGVKYFAKGDKKQVTVTYGGVKVPLDEVKLTLMSSSNVTLDSSTGTIEFGGLSCQAQPPAMRDLHCIPSEHAILLVEAKGATAFVSLPYVGYAIDKTEVHQYFPEPAAGATGLDLLNTTRPEVPSSWARRLYATITYSDGSKDIKVSRYHDNNFNGLGIFKIKGDSSNKGTALLLGNSTYSAIGRNDGSWYQSSGSSAVREMWYRQQKVSTSSTSWPTEPSGLFIANDMTVPNATSSPGTAVGDKYYVSTTVWTYSLPSSSPIFDLLLPSANGNFFYSIDENPIELTVVSGDSYVNATWGVLAPDSSISHGPITAGDVESVVSDPMWSSYPGRTTGFLNGVRMGYFSWWAEGMGMLLPSGQIGVCGHLYPESNSNVNNWSNGYRVGLASISAAPRNALKYSSTLNPSDQEELLGWLYSTSGRMLGVNYTAGHTGSPMVGHMNGYWDYNIVNASQSDRFLLQCIGCKYGGNTYLESNNQWGNVSMNLQCSTP